jgi:cell fate regulator YaaT (PSP1 superfamily)
MDEKETKSEEEVVVAIKRIVGVQFSTAGKEQLFDAEDYQLDMHEFVVVEGDKGPIIGRVSLPPFEKKASDVATNIRKVVRKASEEDVDKKQKNREEAMRSFNLCQEKIVEHGLPMKLVDVNVLTGDTKAIFYFTAEERVDFRALVKDLATSLHMRIEMRQIGARDASKCIGGLGSCGLVCCCVKHLRDFKSISIQMAKNQGLSPNPSKLTGMCGKLKCCLSYENEMYSKLKKQMPGPGSYVETPKGEGSVNSLDVPRQLVYVYIPDLAKEIRFPLDEVKKLKGKVRERPEKDGAKKERTGKERPGRERGSKKRGTADHGKREKRGKPNAGKKR